jgi:hypothetical protein
MEGVYHYGFVEDLNKTRPAGWEVTMVTVWPKVWTIDRTNNSDGITVTQRIFISRPVFLELDGKLVHQANTFDWLMAFASVFLEKLHTFKQSNVQVIIPNIASVPKVEIYPAGFIAKDESVIGFDLTMKLYQCSTA